MSEEHKRKISSTYIPWTGEQKLHLSLISKGQHHCPRTEFTSERAKLIRAKTIIPLKDNSIEVKIQNYLKQLGISFLTHQYMHIEHGYQCDILIPSMNLVIECDGDAMHFNPVKYKPDDKIFKNGMTAKERWILDYLRTNELKNKGYVVLRLWESKIKTLTLDNFKERIKVT